MTIILFVAQLVCVVFLYFLLVPKSETRSIVEDHMISSPGSVPLFFVIFLAICIGLNPNVYRWCGNDDIASMPVGEYCYYVEIGREFDTESRVYTLPAKVEVYRSDYGNAYRIKNVYFNNGGYLTVRDGTFELGEELYFCDQDGEYWVGTFTNERCAPSPFVESDDTPPLYTILFAFDVLIVVLTYISLRISVLETIKVHKLRESLPDCDLYYSLFGEHYHSTKDCVKLKSVEIIYEASAYHNEEQLFKRRPCLKCCRMIDGKVYPNDIT